MIDYSYIEDKTNKEQELKSNSKYKQSALDHNHTHFILVDNSILNKFGGEVKLRGLLQKEICEELTEQEFYREKKEKIPCVSIVVGGGPITVIIFFIKKFYLYFL